MDSGILLIQALATTLLSEIDSLKVNYKTLDEVDSLNLYERIREYEIDLIKTALIKTNGNQSRAASMLGIKGTTLNNKLKLYGINSRKLTLDGKTSPS